MCVCVCRSYIHHVVTGVAMWECYMLWSVSTWKLARISVWKLKKKQLLIYSSVHVVICICLLRVLESSDVALHKLSIVYNLMDLIQNKLSKSLLTVASYMVWIFICYFTLSVCCGGILFSHSRTWFHVHWYNVLQLCRDYSFVQLFILTEHSVINVWFKTIKLA